MHLPHGIARVSTPSHHGSQRRRARSAYSFTRSLLADTITSNDATISPPLAATAYPWRNAVPGKCILKTPRARDSSSIFVVAAAAAEGHCRRVHFDEESIVTKGINGGVLDRDDALGVSLPISGINAPEKSLNASAAEEVPYTVAWGEDSEWFNELFGLKAPPSRGGKRNVGPLIEGDLTLHSNTKEDPARCTRFVGHRAIISLSHAMPNTPLGGASWGNTSNFTDSAGSAVHVSSSRSRPRINAVRRVPEDHAHARAAVGRGGESNRFVTPPRLRLAPKVSSTKNCFWDRPKSLGVEWKSERQVIPPQRRLCNFTAPRLCFVNFGRDGGKHERRRRGEWLIPTNIHA
ncbi:hypothetical protein TcYC6_0109870 [Trypanosoma cruzi]|nr:hypothetical protein TcYC6_0109870 [Trypanosoma cruzi]